MSRFSFQFRILTARWPFAKGEKAQRLMQAIRNTLQSFVNTLNAVYDARWITTATGEDLDRHGETLAIPRNPNEDDDTYRSRLLLDLSPALTHEAVKNAVQGVLNETPEIQEIAAETQPFPLDWPSTLRSYAQSHHLRLVVSGVLPQQEKTLQDALKSVLLATAKAQILQPRSPEGYTLILEVRPWQ